MMTTTMKTLMMGALATAALVAAAPHGLSAQGRIGCFRGKPLPECTSFWIVEMQGFLPLAQTSRTVTAGPRGFEYTYESQAFEEQVEWNVGHMVNAGDGYAVGGVMTVGPGKSDALRSVKLRGRKWLSENMSIELEAGLLRDNTGDIGWASGSGWTSDLRVNLRDQASLFVRYDGVRIPEEAHPETSAYFDPGGAQHGFSVGVSAGSWPALVATGAANVVLLVLYAADRGK